MKSNTPQAKELADYYAEAARKLQLASDSLKRSAATMRMRKFGEVK